MEYKKTIYTEINNHPVKCKINIKLDTESDYLSRTTLQFIISYIDLLSEIIARIESQPFFIDLSLKDNLIADIDNDI